MTSNDEIRERLHQYVENITLIRELSSPMVNEVDNAEDYRELLINNFTRIGELAKENTEILNNYYFPLFNDEGDIDRDKMDVMTYFSQSLVNVYKLNFIDTPMIYEQAKALLKRVEKGNDDSEIVVALDNMVSIAYAMIGITGRLYPVNDVCLTYQKEGLEASYKLLEYLEHDKFKKLDDVAKELVLVNARYIRVVFEIDGVPLEKGEEKILLERMKKVLALGDDAFYREELPSYDWNYHVFRTLEYIVSLTDLCNDRGFDENDIQFINECTKRFEEMYESDLEYYDSIHNAKVKEIYACRNGYLAHEISLEDYKQELKNIFEVYSNEKHDVDSLSSLYAPLEYIMVIDKDNLKKEDIEFLNRFYSFAISFMHKTPKKESLMFLIYLISMILENCIEVPGGMDFETICLNMIAAIHAPSYVHTINVADLSLCIAQHLYKEKPELFEGLPFFEGKKTSKEKVSALRNYVYHAALCHDFGKLMIAETIMTYGRNLLPSEYDLVYSHPSAGAHLLLNNTSTKEYADVARGHHKWYNDEFGYPDDFKLKDSEYKTIIEIVTCADCLDASTDAVGRSYKKGISLDNFLEELKEGSGTRYAPYLYELVSKEEVRKEIEDLLTKGRKENYKKAFEILQTYETNW